MKEGSSGGASLCKGFHEGDLEGGFLYWGTLLLLLLGARGHQEYKSGGHLEL
jgi:hypothetical protein